MFTCHICLVSFRSDVGAVLFRCSSPHVGIGSHTYLVQYDGSSFLASTLLIQPLMSTYLKADGGFGILSPLGLRTKWASFFLVDVALCGLLDYVVARVTLLLICYFQFVVCTATSEQSCSYTLVHTFGLLCHTYFHKALRAMHSPLGTIQLQLPKQKNAPSCQNCWLHRSPSQGGLGSDTSTTFRHHLTLYRRPWNFLFRTPR